MSERTKILTRYALAAMAFAMALVLTPRALLDVTDQADSYEIPVDMLDPSEGCLWCSEVQDLDDDTTCGDTDDSDRLWSDADDFEDGCVDITILEPSA